jgi:hypothetical protein
MTLYSFGCSLTFGTDLKDDGHGLQFARPSNFTWPALVAQQRGWNYECQAVGGTGNLCIVDRLLKHLYYHPDEFYIINWTFIDRFDYSDPNGSHFNNGLRDYISLRPNETDNNGVAGYYFKYLHSEYRDKITNLIYIKTALDMLKAKNVKFIMTSIDDLLFCDRWHAPPHVIDMQQEIRPYITSFENRNFLDWSQHRDFEISATGHPLEAAHAAAAELVQPSIDAILHRA